MALEPAGVSLEAEGFQKYLKQLEEIDKKQQEVFDTKFKDTQKSFAEVTKAAQKYEKELKDLATAERRAQNEAKKLAVAQKTAAATQRQAAISTSNAILQVAGSFAQFAVENAKLAAQFKGQQTGLKNLAASFGESGSEIQSAIQTASRGTISGLQAIQAANQGLLLGVAKTPAEFDKLTKVALTLGRTMGLTGTQAIEQFTTALGRRSLLILDNFGISAKAVNAEIERLALADFGVANAQLNEAQKNATFMKAALTIAGDAAAAIGEESNKAAEAFERLEATGQNLRVTFGELARPLSTSISDALSRAATTAQKFFAFLGAGFAGVGTTASGIIDNIGRLFRGEATRTLDEILQEGSRAAADRFKEIASTIAGVSFGTEKATKAIQQQEQAVKEDTEAIKALNQAVQQAEQLQLSFARAAEDAALKLARQQEDVARKTARQVIKLEEQQAKDRDKLLKEQQKELDKFEDDRLKEISSAEADIVKEQKQAADDRLKQQRDLQRQLAQAQARFNLSQLQSERRFKLSERRLIAEGDILAIQQLREDQELSRQEEAENFALSGKETKDNAKEQQKEQQNDFEQRINDLKVGLEEQRAELLASFDEELIAQQQSQAEAQAEQQRGFAEQTEDRIIALQREEEDRRISQERQLEDLGRSLANQKDVTEEGVTAIAGELEKIFGQEGVADIIISGFASRTESEFTELFSNIEEIVSSANVPLGLPSDIAGSGRIGGIPRFHEGGVVAGPVGQPQLAVVKSGETILPTHKQSFIMPAPVVPSQTLSVEMSGGFSINGSEGASSNVIEAAIEETTNTLEIAIRRLARRSNV